MNGSTPKRGTLLLRIFMMSMAMICVVQGYAQKEGRAEIDSLQHKLATLKADNHMKASVYEKIGMEYYFLKEYDSATNYFSEASDIYESMGNAYGTGRVKQMSQQIELNKSEAKEKLLAQSATGVAAIMLIIAVVVMFMRHKKQKATNALLLHEKEKSEALLLNILPAHVAHQLKEKGMLFAEQFDSVTVIFTDFVGFTRVAERFSPKQLVGELHGCFKAFDDALEKYNIEKIKTVGDAYLAVAGLGSGSKNHAADAVAFALYMQRFMHRRKSQLGDATFNMRIGVHTGGVVAGIVGVKKYAYDIWGDAVNTAARMEQNCEQGRINISEATYELVKDKFTCEYRGEITAKGKGQLKMYYVE